ncbi:MAG: MSHA biogenesis protein MshO [Oceanospirillaceae bacterium]|mgnify:CR=1 FL=1|nr:MSHA biogenesis protein MshO [Oceanospirillaceae bacterium]MBT12935.1 MSHA biogenesis protein MshO [Oceanospirillaceae bacterium]|tara:strand:+ start:37335 stop:38126 length:792 start_codon:yes stop_codon:yes gene_type:complete
MQRRAAFTLVEMVMTIMIGSIIAVISVQFISRSAQSMLDTGERQRLADTADIISEQISRRVRYALPGSLRVTSDQRCLEFMPLVSVTAYTRLDRGGLSNSLTALPVSATDSVSGHLSIYPILGNLYNPSTAGPLTRTEETLPAGSAEVDIVLSEPHRFPRTSPQQRLFISGAPQTICQQDNWLYLYSGYGFINNTNQLQAALPSAYSTGREVLANQLQTGSLVFSYQPATLRRNALVTFSYTLQDQRGNTLSLAQEVQVRNVP